MGLLDLRLFALGIVVAVASILLAVYSVKTILIPVNKTSTVVVLHPETCADITIRWYGPVRIEVEPLSNPVKMCVLDILERPIVEEVCSSTCNVTTRVVSRLVLCGLTAENTSVRVEVVLYRLYMPNAHYAIPSIALCLLALALMLLSVRGVRSRTQTACR